MWTLTQEFSFPRGMLARPNREGFSSILVDYFSKHREGTSHGDVNLEIKLQSIVLGIYHLSKITMGNSAKVYT